MSCGAQWQSLITWAGCSRVIPCVAVCHPFVIVSTAVGTSVVMINPQAVRAGHDYYRQGVARGLKLCLRVSLVGIVPAAYLLGTSFVELIAW